MPCVTALHFPAIKVRPDTSNVVISNDFGIKVRMKKLDDLPIPESKIALLKIYVEGYEKFVFLGAKNFLSKVDCVHFSCNVKKFEENDYDYEEIFSILKLHGFKLYGFKNENSIFSLTSEYLAKKEEMLAIRNIDDFVKRTNFVVSEN